MLPAGIIMLYAPVILPTPAPPFACFPGMRFIAKINGTGILAAIVTIKRVNRNPVMSIFNFRCLCIGCFENIVGDTNLKSYSIKCFECHERQCNAYWKNCLYYFTFIDECLSYH